MKAPVEKQATFFRLLSVFPRHCNRNVGWMMEIIRRRKKKILSVFLYKECLLLPTCYLLKIVFDSSIVAIPKEEQVEYCLGFDIKHEIRH